MSLSLVFPTGGSSGPLHTGTGGCLERVPKAPETVPETCVKLSFCKSALRSKDGSSELAWPWSLEGQLLIGVDVEMGAGRGGEKEKTEGESEDCVSDSCPN